MKNLLLITLCITTLSLAAQDQPTIKTFQVETEYIWDSITSDFVLVKSSKVIGDIRIVTASPDWTRLKVVIKTDEYDVVVEGEILNMLNTDGRDGLPLTVVRFQDGLGFPFLFEIDLEGNSAFYYGYLGEGQGYNGFSGGEGWRQISMNLESK